MTKAISFHPTCIPSKAGFRAAVGINRHDGVQSRMVGKKTSPFLFSDRDAAVAFARKGAEIVAADLAARFPACAFAVAPSRANIVAAVAETDPSAWECLILGAGDSVAAHAV